MFVSRQYYRKACFMYRFKQTNKSAIANAQFSQCLKFVASFLDKLIAIKIATQIFSETVFEKFCQTVINVMARSI